MDSTRSLTLLEEALKEDSKQTINPTDTLLNVESATSGTCKSADGTLKARKVKCGYGISTQRPAGRQQATTFSTRQQTEERDSFSMSRQTFGFLVLLLLLDACSSSYRQILTCLHTEAIFFLKRRLLGLDRRLSCGGESCDPKSTKIKPIGAVFGKLDEMKGEIL